METKLLISVIVVALVGLTLVGYAFFNDNSSRPENEDAVALPQPQPAGLLPNPIDPGGQYTDYKATGDNSYTLDAFLAGIGPTTLVLRTSQRELELPKLSSTRYLLSTGGSTQQITETQLKDNEAVRVMVRVDRKSNAITSLAITAVRSPPPPKQPIATSQ